MIVERTNYYAKPGRAEEVLAQRRAACAARVAMGLPAGSIRVKAEASADGPDVSWELAFASHAARREDLDARAASAAFTAVRAGMSTLIDRFERLVEERAPAAPGWAGDVPLEGHAIVPETHAFASDGRELKGYLFRPPGRGPWPLVIYNHGSGLDQGSEDAVQPGIAALLLSWGIACFYPHRRGYGNSPGPTWRSECPAETFSPAYNAQIIARLDKESDDVIAAHDHARGLPDIDPDRIAVMGSSFGGVNSLFAAAKDARFRCAIDFAGAAMNWDRNPDIAAAMIAAALRVTIPVFYGQAENDFSTRPTREIAAALAGGGKPYEARIYPAYGLTAWEGHLLAGRGQQIWAADVRSFLERWL